MARKKRFTDESPTKPGPFRSRAPESRRSNPAPKTKRELAEAPTLPPPPPSEDVVPPTRPSGRAGDRTSGVRTQRGKPSGHPSATVDEVTADMSKDPRRERDDD
jgi:hypothetical protein